MASIAPFNNTKETESTTNVKTHVFVDVDALLKISGSTQNEYKETSAKSSAYNGYSCKLASYLALCTDDQMLKIADDFYIRNKRPSFIKSTKDYKFFVAYLKVMVKYNRRHPCTLSFEGMSSADISATLSLMSTDDFYYKIAVPYFTRGILPPSLNSEEKKNICIDAITSRVKLKNFGYC